MVDRVGIVGSRHWTDWRPIHRLIDGLEDRTRVVSGDAAGADAIALQHAKDCFPRLTANKLRANWKGRGLAAGPLRNAEVVACCQWLVAFWDGKVEHSGTLDAFRKAVDAGLPAVLFWDRTGRQESP